MGQFFSDRHCVEPREVQKLGQKNHAVKTKNRQSKNGKTTRKTIKNTQRGMSTTRAPIF